MSEQPKEYIITEYELDEIFAFLQNPHMFDIPEFTLEIEHQIRSRPAHAAGARKRPEAGRPGRGSPARRGLGAGRMPHQGGRGFL